jgi:hypothetical protein
MNNKQQMGVEWLVEQFKEYDFADVKDTENYIIKMQSFVLTEKLEKAKEIEKERMIGLLKWMNKIASENPMRLETDDDDIVQQYYNEIYGDDKQ